MALTDDFAPEPASAAGQHVGTRAPATAWSEPGFLDDEDGFARRVATLTQAQHQVLDLMARGRLNKQIAHECGVAPSTVKAHVSEILRKLGVGSRTAAAVRYAVFKERCRVAPEGRIVRLLTSLRD